MSLPVVVRGGAEGGLLAQAYLTQCRPVLQINPSFPLSNCQDSSSLGSEVQLGATLAQTSGRVLCLKSAGVMNFGHL